MKIKRYSKAEEKFLMAFAFVSIVFFSVGLSMDILIKSGWLWFSLFWGLSAMIIGLVGWANEKYAEPKEA